MDDYLICGGLVGLLVFAGWLDYRNRKAEKLHQARVDAAWKHVIGALRDRLNRG